MALDTVKIPSLEQLRDVAAELGFSLTDADLLAHREALLPSFEAYNLLDRMPDELPPVSYPRLPGRRPASEENRHGAWYVKTDIEGAGSGKLKGKKVGLKDNVCLAGVPMMNGASDGRLCAGCRRDRRHPHPRRGRLDRRQDSL